MERYWYQILLQLYPVLHYIAHVTDHPSCLADMNSIWLGNLGKLGSNKIQALNNDDWF